MNDRNKIAVSLIFSILAAVGLGRDIYVATNGASASPFTSWPDAATNIEWAVNAATNGETVWISNGTYVLTNQVAIASNITICGYTNNGPAIVDGNNANRCFYFNIGITGVMAGLFITRGYTNGNGGGAYIRGGVVRDCVFSNNVSNLGGENGGGGLFVTNSPGNAVLIQRCTFVENLATNGGGVYASYATGVIDNCTFFTNTAKDAGGGLKFYRGLMTITASVFKCNVASNQAGGVFGLGNVVGNPFIISHCTFSSNVASAGYGEGGGLKVYYIGIISNCYISNNIAGKYGGGMFITGTNVLKNSVIARNRTISEASGEGGAGIYATQSPLIQDCIVEENTAGNCGGGLLTKGIIRNCLIRNNIAGTGSAGTGGGIRFDYPFTNLNLFNCTVVSNYAKTSGGGLYSSMNDASTARVENCIIYFNQIGDAGNSSNFYSATLNAYFLNNCLAPAPTIGVITNNITNAAPQFVAWISGDYHLTRQSPCVNAGVNRDWMINATDLDGRHRIDVFSGIVDMGCFENLPAGTMFSVP